MSRRSDEIAKETRDLREEGRELRADYDREITESRRFNRELLIRMEKTYDNIGKTLKFIGDELIAVREELHELKAAVAAQTEAIVRLVDRFGDPQGRPPV